MDKKTYLWSTEPLSELTESPAWKALREHQAKIAPLQMRDLFAQDADRFNKFSLRYDDILLDVSKNRVTEETHQLLLNLARQADVEGWRDKMFQRRENQLYRRPRRAAYRAPQPLQPSNSGRRAGRDAGSQFGSGPHESVFGGSAKREVGRVIPANRLPTS